MDEHSCLQSFIFKAAQESKVDVKGDHFLVPDVGGRKNKKPYPWLSSLCSPYYKVIFSECVRGQLQGLA